MNKIRCVDINSNIILAGTSNLDYTTIKINNAGAIQWVKKYNSPTGWDQCRGVVTDNTGNIYVTGETGTSGFPLTYKMTTIKYNTNGDEQWVREYNGGSIPSGYYGNDIAIDNTASVYVTGFIYSPSNFATIKYNTAGTFQWAISYNGPANSMDRGVSVGVDNNGNVYTTGNSLGSGTGNDITTIKYSQSAKKLNLTVLIEGFYNSASNKMTKDTAKVFLRNASPPFALVDSAKSVIDSLGKATFTFFNSANGVPYYIVVKHRNSIETWSSLVNNFNDSLNYNFTTSASQAFGNNEILVGLKYCIYSGDVNQDGIVDINDNELIDNDSYNFASGYLATDVNGDMSVDIADAAIADNNAYNFVSRISP
ncbi:MAG: SBBP repeat-containing protein [Bacteroidota bacterium]|nr:SBBP repeat-containing protein [Bacteroidota bacterium]